MNASAFSAAIATLLYAVASAGQAENAASEALLTGVNLQRMPNADGGSMSVAFLRTNPTHVVTVGAETTSIGQSEWSVLRITGAQNRGGAPAVSASLDIGPGSNDDDPFTFLKVGLGLSGAVTERWTLFAQSMYVDVEPVSGNIVTFGGDMTRGDGLSFRVQTSQSISGTLDERGFLGRIDYRKKPPYYMAGIAASTTNNRLSFGSVPIEVPATRVRQAFFGLSFPTGRHDLTVAAEVGRIGDFRRAGLSFFVRSPLGPRQ